MAVKITYTYEPGARSSGKYRYGAIAPKTRTVIERAADAVNQASSGTKIGEVRVYSGGQPTGKKRKGSKIRTPFVDKFGGGYGSTRHDLGGAADVHLYDANGKRIDYSTAAGKRVFDDFAGAAAQAGATGIGFGSDYMGTGTIHVGFGNMATWGGMPSSMRNAVVEGWQSQGPDAVTWNTEDVARAQIGRLGYVDANGNPDIAAFQAANGLLIDGVLGPRTQSYAYLADVDAAGKKAVSLAQMEAPGSLPAYGSAQQQRPTPPASIPEATFADASQSTLRRRRRPPVDNRVKYLQQTLNDNFGFNLEVDGQFGKATKDAVKAFQKTAGLKEDGVVGQNTWGRLGEWTGETGIAPDDAALDTFGVPRAAGRSPPYNPAMQPPRANPRAAELNAPRVPLSTARPRPRPTTSQPTPSDSAILTPQERGALRERLKEFQNPRGVPAPQPAPSRQPMPGVSMMDDAPGSVPVPRPNPVGIARRRTQMQNLAGNEMAGGYAGIGRQPSPSTTADERRTELQNLMGRRAANQAGNIMARGSPNYPTTPSAPRPRMSPHPVGRPELQTALNAAAERQAAIPRPRANPTPPRASDFGAVQTPVPVPRPRPSQVGTAPPNAPGPVPVPRPRPDLVPENTKFYGDKAPLGLRLAAPALAGFAAGPVGALAASAATGAFGGTGSRVQQSIADAQLRKAGPSAITAPLPRPDVATAAQPTAPAPRSDRLPRGADAVKALQRTLKSQGFDPGPVDGIMGPRTQAAVDSARRAQETGGLSKRRGRGSGPGTSRTSGGTSSRRSQTKGALDVGPRSIRGGSRGRRF